MKVKLANEEDIRRFGGTVHACARHTQLGWQASCDECGYSFASIEDLGRYHAFCGFGPTTYDVVPAKKNPIDGSPA